MKHIYKCTLPSFLCLYILLADMLSLLLVVFLLLVLVVRRMSRPSRPPGPPSIPVLGCLPFIEAKRGKANYYKVGYLLGCSLVDPWLKS